MKLKSLIVFFCSWCIVWIGHSQTRYASRIVLIPLDDRPPCLQFPSKMGLIGHAEIVCPPRSILGRFTEFGKSDSIGLWLEKQDWKSFDAAIISLDMLAYGGLVASRVHETPLETALKRLTILKNIRKKAPQLKIYGSSVIMRLAPTADGKNEAYREKLARWADFSPYPEHKTRVEELEKEIPTTALLNYKNARKRNWTLNMAAVQLVKDKIIDFLILSQDDAKPKGVHIKDRETLIQAIDSLNLKNQIAVQPGADEVSMLLLARALSDKYHYHPRIKAIYSSDSMARQAMPFEDRPLSQTVSFHIKAIGAEEVTEVSKADILFYVFTSRFEKGRANSFLDEIQHCSKPFIIADIDPKGDVQGGDIDFTEGGKARGLFNKIYGYASWNTAGNAIGTALPHGFLSSISKTVLKKKTSKKAQKQMAYAQKWFVMNRLLDDFAYHSIVRPQALALIKERKWNAFRLTPEQTQEVEDFCLKQLLPLSLEWLKKLDNTEGVRMTPFYFDLPWNRTFEAEIDFL